MDHAGWMATGAKGSKLIVTKAAQERFGEDAPSRVAGAEEQDVVGMVIHAWRGSRAPAGLSNGRLIGYADMAALHEALLFRGAIGRQLLLHSSCR